METLRLTQKGLLVGQDGKPLDDPLPALSTALELEGGCTLRTFFSMLAGYPVLQKLSHFLPGSLEEATKCPSAGCLCDDLRILVLGKTMELIGFPGKPRAELYMWLRGLDLEAARVPAEDDTDLPQESRLAALMEADREIRFIPLQMLLDTPLFLGGLKHMVLGDVNRKLFCSSRFTLFEVVDGLAWELGFQGGTQQCSLGR